MLLCLPIASVRIVRPWCVAYLMQIFRLWHEEAGKMLRCLPHSLSQECSFLVRCLPGADL
jgi:hypothetical protein